MKVVFQKLWELKLEWDEDVPTDLQQKHTLWRNLLTLFKDLPFDRCYFRTGDTIKTTELHCFSDASEDAYAAMAYLRATYESGPPMMVLVAAKTKVAPLTKDSPYLIWSCVELSSWQTPNQSEKCSKNRS